MIEKIKAQDVLSSCREQLGLTGEPEMDDVFLAGALRRSAGYQCPCSRTVLRSTLNDSLRHLHDEPERLAGRLDDLIDELIVVGDLLELSQVSIDDSEAKGTWVFAAPPSFVARRSGSIFLAGVVPDGQDFLPESLAKRVKYRNCTRVIEQKSEEDLAETLRALGIQELHENVWFKPPRKEGASELLARHERQLEDPKLNHSGTLGEIKILDPDRDVEYYPRRWISPKNQTGFFVARRPQEFGANLWCFVRLKEGAPDRVVDFPSPGFRWRGCDEAWYLQMAIDKRLGRPQRYRRRTAGDSVRFDFFSPLPLWMRRRFALLGEECQPDRSLLAYEIPACEAEDEEKFLKERLWLAEKEV